MTDVFSRYNCTYPCYQDETSLDRLLECQLELAAAAVHNQDFEKAVKLYDEMETPEAAWNKAQVNSTFVL